MSLFASEDLAFTQTIRALVEANPFGQARQGLEQEALGRPLPRDDPWQLGPGHENDHLAPLLERAELLLTKLTPRLGEIAESELPLLGALGRFCLYYRFEPDLYRLHEAARAGVLTRAETPYRRFTGQLERFVPSDRLRADLFGDPAHLFAYAFQLRRAFSAIFERIIGGSRPAADLRARVWESVFTANPGRYERRMYAHMHEINTLVTGPSGTGKELVASAIARSRYLPFDPIAQRFSVEESGSYLALNLSALSHGLVESELFGHKRGSFTGASGDRAGFFESCPAHGTVFLDEIGESPIELQIKLLRTLQTREFHRVGDSEPRRFVGKLVAATNRDLEREVTRGTFRGDFFHRLRADRVTTPGLRAQLDDRAEDLPLLVAALSRSIVGQREQEALTDEVLTVIARDLPDDYRWPGNVRELEQCVRSVLVRGSYEPATDAGPSTAGRAARSQRLGETLLDGLWSFDDLGDLYVTLAHDRLGSYSETGRALGLDRRTVRARVRPELLDRLSE